jgi:hypothetical protein
MHKLRCTILCTVLYAVVSLLILLLVCEMETYLTSGAVSDACALKYV